MLANSPDHCELTLHIVLATFPQKQEEEFNNTVISEHFEKYRKNTKSYCNNLDKNYLFCEDDKKKTIPVLYNPLRYYILGNYDVAYISLIDNFKFAQRLFEPGNANLSQSSIFSPHTFQSFTGINTHTGKDLRKFFFENLSKSNGQSKYFLSICNLKLNNGFLIGNGKDYLKRVKLKIEKIIDKFNKSASEFEKVEYLLVQSFSWFEYSLLLFTNNPDSFSVILIALRTLSLKDLTDSTLLLNNSLYKELFKESDEKLLDANVFADTHTYVGLHADLIDLNPSKHFVRSFLNDIIKHRIKLKTEIEWQVKPGHMHLLINLLKKSEFGKNLELPEKYLLAGKTDYLIHEKVDSVLTNYSLLKLIFKTNSNLYNHVRKIQTKVLFPWPGNKNKPDRVTLNLQSQLKKLTVQGSKSKQVDSNLKALKISRQIRSKILKIFTNYNNGIQDVILFPFFLDFKIFIDELIDLIIEEKKRWELTKRNFVSSLSDLEKFSQRESFAVSVLEDILMRKINIFQEGFYVRTLNCYQYEDITDFDLDFNGSLQQLLSAYSSIINELGYIFYENKYSYGPVVQLNLKDTIGTYNSINYYVHHLSSPEFVFATVSKEILNNVDLDTEEVAVIYKAFNTLCQNLNWEHRHLVDFVSSGVIDMKYFIIDIVRFVISYDMDYDLFYYWFWTHNLQNPLLYEKSGMINEIHFQKELFRAIFVAKYFNIDIEKVYCPLPELFTFWERHRVRICGIIDTLITVLKRGKTHSADSDNTIFQSISQYLLSRTSQYLNSIVPDNFVSSDDYSSESRQKLDFLNNLARENRLIKINHILFFNREFLFKGFAKNKKDYNKHKGTVAYVQWYMLSYLKEIKAGNHDKISFLKRNWNSGLPLKCFILNKDAVHLYKVDQTGGLFFDNMSKLNAYMRLSSRTLYDLLHFSMLSKKQFIIHKIKKVK